MSNIKNKAITSRDEDFAKWYTDIVLRAELIDYSAVKGCLIIRPYGYAIWENIQKVLDNEFKKMGHQNVYMPLFIPESLLNKEKEHVEGFAPEVAWVTHGGKEELAEKLCVRPTSETLFCDWYAKIVKSYRDLPKLYNQWCSVVRWEKTTRPFLRSREFLWQEGHTIHATKEEAVDETIKMLNVYDNFFTNYLAIPAIKGQKTEKEKFAGAVNTYSIESLMYNGVALQSGTSHYFGTNFAKPFNIMYTDRANEQQYVHQTSWGASTRLIGALIMVHSDDNGLVLPPHIAPIKVAIIPINNDDNVINTANIIDTKLKENDISTILDISDKSPGFKFAEYEMKGVPIRIEIGPKDIENNQCVLVRRDTSEKKTISLDNFLNEVTSMLETIQKNLFDQALRRREEKTFEANSIEEMKNIIDKQPGFIKALWCEDKNCEITIKEKTGISSRCMPFDQPKLTDEDKCVCCGKKATKLVYWGLQY